MADETSNAASAPQRATFRQVLGNRGFLLLWVGQFVSSFGDWLAILALFSLIAFRWKGTPEQVAGIFVAFILPFAVLGPLAGVFVDRWNLKRTMIASDVLRAGLVVLFALAGAAWQVYAVMALVSVVSSFFLPAMNAAIPRLVKKEELLVANSLNAQTVHFNKIVAPAIAGLLVAWAGEKACFYLDAVSFVFSAGMIAAVKIVATEERAAKKGLGPVLAEFREGFLFLHGHRALRFVVLAMASAMFIIGAFDALIAVYVRETLHADSKVFGALVSMIGIGTIIGSVWVGKYAQQKPKILLIVGGILGIGVGVFLLALATTAPAAVACSLALGLAVSAVLIPSQTLTQQETPPAMLGRVSSVSISLMTVAQLVGVAASGKLAAWMGIRHTYMLLAALLGTVGAGGFAFAMRMRLHGAEPANE
ncbi:MAG: MFS transporter [Acidobacteria bacterium]|nr:MFS transporter [Acidobacteriota bacterium]